MMEVFQISRKTLADSGGDARGWLRLFADHASRDKPLFYALISEFSALTSVRLVFNRCFNENEPVVCRPEEGLDCFLRTKMDVIVLGAFVVQQNMSV
jgi:carbamoyltransferase